MKPLRQKARYAEGKPLGQKKVTSPKIG